MVHDGDKIIVDAASRTIEWLVDDETKEQDSATESMIASVAAFIRLFDYVSLDGDSTAPDALKSLFRSRPKVLRSIFLSSGFPVSFYELSRR